MVQSQSCEELARDIDERSTPSTVVCILGSEADCDNDSICSELIAFLSELFLDC